MSDPSAPLPLEPKPGALTAIPDQTGTGLVSSATRVLLPLLWPAIPLILILAFNFFFTPGFFHVEVKNGHYFGSLIDVLKNGAPTVILALGMVLVIATGGIDLSVGAVMALCGAVSACLLALPDDSPLHAWNFHGRLFPIVGVSLVFALISGLWNGVLVALFRLQPIVATLILMVAGRGLAQLITNGQIPTFNHPRFEFLGGGFLFGFPFPFVLGLILAAIMILLIRVSALGLFIESVGANPVAARLAGINATGVKIACYTLCSILAGVAGLIAASDIKAGDVNNIGANPNPAELDAILAVALGGTSLNGGRFSLIGSILGALTLQLLGTTILARGVSPDAIKVVKAAVIIAVCLLQSRKFRDGVARLFKGRAA